MMGSRLAQVPAFVPAALTASQVGTWETDFPRDLTICDGATAALFGVDPSAAARGLPLSAFARAIHPADRSAFHEKLGRIRAQGGLFVVEYRTCPSEGVLRWVLARGRYEFDPDAGGVTGRGIVIDITESKLDGHVEDRAFFLGAHADPATSLDRVADHAIAARRAIDELPEPSRRSLRARVDALLLDVGCALASREG